MKKSAGMVVFILAVLLFLFFLSSGKKPPLIPRDALHSNVTTNEACTSCHGPGKQAPLKEGHPPKEQCLLCHKAQVAA